MSSTPRLRVVQNGAADAQDEFTPPDSSINLVDTGDINVSLQDDLVRDLMNMIRSDQEITPERLSDVVDKVIDTLPEPIRVEIQDVEAMKVELMQVLNGFVSVFKEKEGYREKDKVENVHVQNLVANMMAVFVKYHATSRVLDPNMSPEQVEDRYNPYIKSDHQMALVGKRLSALAIWVASAYTSWMGVAHYGGMALGEFEQMFGLNIPGQLEYVIRATLGAAGAVAISQTVLKVKTAIETIANEQNLGFLRATKEAVGTMTRDKRFLALMLLCGVVFLDGATNTSGIFAMAGARKDANAQVAGASAQIMDRVDAVRAEMDGFKKDIPVQVDDKAKAIIAAELGGTSETDQSGTGPMYHTKVALYMEDGTSLAELQGTPLSDNLRGVLDASGLIDGKTMKVETEETIDDSLSTVESLLDQVEEDVNNLNSGKALEIIQEDINKIVEKLAQAISILNEDLQDDVEDHLDRYTALNEKIARIALESGQYPGFRSDRLTGFDFPAVDIDNAPIDVAGMEYRDTIELWKAAVEGSKPAASVILLMIALLGGLALSQGDQLLIGRTRKAYATDRRREDEIKGEYFDKMIKRIAFVLSRVLNQGPWAEYFKEVKIHPGLIVEAIESRVQEVANKENGNGSKLQRTATGWKNAASTDVAVEHNARVRALQQVMASPEEIFGLIQTLLPGIREMRGKGLGTKTAFAGGDKRKQAKQMNRQHLDRENTRAQQADIFRVQNSITSIAVDNTLTLTVAENAITFLNVDAQAEIENIEAEVTSSNVALLDKVKKYRKDKLVELHIFAANHIEAQASRLPINEGCSEDRLRTFEGTIDHLRRKLQFVQLFSDATPAFNDAHLNAANLVLDNAVQALANARATQAQSEEEGERARVAKELQESKRATLQALGAWYDLRTENAASLTPARRADILLARLGEPNCISTYGCIPSEREDAVLDNLERVMNVLREALENPALTDPTTRKRYVDMDCALEEDRALIHSFLQSNQQ